MGTGVQSALPGARTVCEGWHRDGTAQHSTRGAVSEQYEALRPAEPSSEGLSVGFVKKYKQCPTTALVFPNEIICIENAFFSPPTS